MGTSLSAAELPGAPIGWKAGLQRQGLVARSKNSLSGFRPTADRDALNDPNKKSGLRAAFLLGALTSFQFQIKAAISRHSGASRNPDGVCEETWMPTFAGMTVIDALN